MNKNEREEIKKMFIRLREILSAEIEKLLQEELSLSNELKIAFGLVKLVIEIDKILPSPWTNNINYVYPEISGKQYKINLKLKETDAFK
ncbi:MAG: hypothetical protein DRH33_04085 [Candidatus Nealsonbacteria bacterium]|nr:MAG: hypothetical protein DRH33_04085 [Candidatus Nealsonbacteria bacterium]